MGEVIELLPCPPQTAHDLENIEKFVEAAFAAYNFRPHEFFPHFGRRLIDAVKELNRRAEARQAPEKYGGAETGTSGAKRPGIAGLPGGAEPLPAGTVTDDAWRQITSTLLKEAERMCGPGPMLERLEAAFAARPAEPVAVKGLEWAAQHMDQRAREILSSGSVTAIGMSRIYEDESAAIRKQR